MAAMKASRFAAPEAGRALQETAAVVWRVPDRRKKSDPMNRHIFV